jgi:glutamyl-tRNA reductase
MNIILLSINFKKAPIHIREKYAFNEDNIAQSLRAIKSTCHIDEAIITSTCNRTEIYATANDLTKADTLLRWWQTTKKCDDEINEYVVIKYNTEAVHHLMRTACGIESMVLGEPQILGQLKHAYSLARQSQTLGSNLSLAFESAFSVAKRVRTTTKLGACPVSVAFSAVSLAKANFEDLTNKNVLIIGAGKTAKLVAQHIRSCQPKKITIANRTYENAKNLAQSVNADAINLSDIYESHLYSADIIVCAVSNVRQPLITSVHADKLNGCLLVDLSIPRSISIENIAENVSLYSIDDINKTLKDNEQIRLRAAKIAEKVIEEKLQQYIANKKVRKASGKIVAFRRHTEDMVETEVQKSLRKLKNGADPQEVLTRFAYTLQNKILHQPTISLRQATVEDHDELIGITHQLFNIEHKQ